MEEERLMILQMVEEGKISSEEAAELLTALEEHARTEREIEVMEEEKHVERSGDKLEQTVEKSAESLEKAATEFADQFEETLSESVERIPSFVERIVEGLNISSLSGLFGPAHEFTEVITGEFEADSGAPVELDFTTKNGRIEVIGWDKPGYKLTLVKRVQTATREEAERLAENMVEVEQLPNRLEVGIVEQPGVRGGVKIRAHVPRSLTYEPQLKSSNGRVVVEKLQLNRGGFKTSNGRVVCSEVQAKNIRAETSNGRVVLEGVSGDVVARTSNGRIRVITAGLQDDAEFDLTTSNGTIQVTGELKEELGYDVEASTTLGKIKLQLPDMVFEEDNREKKGRKSVKAHSQDFENKPIKVRIAATTSNGSVKISETA